MQIEKLDKEDALYAPVTLDGTMVTVGVEGNSVTIDAAELETAEQTVVDVYTHGAGEPLTTDTDNINGGIFNVATVVIPPEKTEIIEAGKKKNKQTGKEETVIKVEHLPLDIDAVKVTLWPLPFQVEAPKDSNDAGAEAAAADVKEEK